MNGGVYVFLISRAQGTLTLACQFDRLQSTAGSLVEELGLFCLEAHFLVQLLSHYQIVEELMGHLNVRVAQKSKGG